MKKINSSTAFLTSLILVIGLSFIATFHFFSGMNSKYILISNGLQPFERIIDNYKYKQNRNGLIFSLSLLFSTGSFLIMVLLPNEEKRQQPLKQAQAKIIEPPTRENESPISSPVQQAETDTTPALIPKGSSKNTKGSTIATIDDLDLEDVDLDAAVDTTEGEDDVVYGTGEITTAALIDFVQKYPDSALKFLYRRKLDGKPLSQDEEDIYTVWEQRSMTRGKVKRYILQLMDWEETPKESLYDIWKQLRDHIFEFYGA